MLGLNSTLLDDVELSSGELLSKFPLIAVNPYQ